MIGRTFVLFALAMSLAATAAAAPVRYVLETPGVV